MTQGARQGDLSSGLGPPIWAKMSGEMTPAAAAAARRGPRARRSRLRFCTPAVSFTCWSTRLRPRPCARAKP